MASNRVMRFEAIARGRHDAAQCARLICLAGSLLCLPALGAAQESAGPLTPPPEHKVHRISTEATPEAPELPPQEIIRRFSQKEDEYLEARLHFWNRKTIRVQEMDPDGKPSGEFTLITEPAATPEGKLIEKIVKQEQTTLRYLRFEPEDVETLARIPAYPLTTNLLVKYDLKYAGKEQVDEIECYIFQVKPKILERQRPLFEGVVWVDDKYLDVVKTYGKWVTELGDVHSPVLPFTMFETYREQVEGKYWLPAYSRSDDFLRLKDETVPIRLIIKWTDYKQVSPVKTPVQGVVPPSTVKKKP